jgi:2-polyprenyl-6-methoxyphenol hydroxylase-like FAD-dependent oxidoreductase
MKNLNILIIGGGIGGLTSAIALRRKGHNVTVIEKDPDWSVYGVGIIQQSNVIRAMAELDLVDDYVSAGVPFDKLAVYNPDGSLISEFPLPRLVEGYPASIGIGRPALHKILGDRTIANGAQVRLGVTATEIVDTGDEVRVSFSDGSSGIFDIVVGADGVYSQTRETIVPEASLPEFTGQAVWRYNFSAACRSGGSACV